jgi:hypothetical protein
MGYELNRLMKQYGVATPTMAGYTGTTAPGTPPTAPAASASQADQDKYNKDKAAFDEQLRKYQLDTKSYDQYTKAYQDRLANTNMYNQAQFSTTGANVPAITTFSPMQKHALGYGTAPMNEDGTPVPASQSGFGIGQERANQNIRNWFAANPNATPNELADVKQKYGVNDYDIRNALGTGTQYGTPQWKDAIQGPYYGAAPLSLGNKTAQEKADFYLNQRGIGYTDADLRTGAEKSFGKFRDSDWAGLLNQAYPQYVNPVIQGYANIGRTGFTGQNAIDYPGYNYWMNQLSTGAATPENINQLMEAAAFPNGRPTVTIPTNPTGPTVLSGGTTTGGATTGNSDTLLIRDADGDGVVDSPTYNGGGNGRDFYNTNVALYAQGGGVSSDVNRLDDNMRKMLGKYDLGMTWGVNPDESYGFHQIYESNPTTEKFISQPYGDYVGVRVKQDDEGNAMYIPMYTGVVPEKEEPKEPKWEWGENSDGSYGFYRYAHGGHVKTHYQTGGRTALGYESPEVEADWLRYWESQQSPVETFAIPSEDAPESAPVAPASPLTVVANEQAAPVEPLPPPPAAAPATSVETPPPASAAPPVLDARTAGLQSLLERYGPQEGGYAQEVAAARQRAQAETTAFTTMLEKMMNSPEDERSSKAEMYFRLAAAFGSPTKTGQFTENLALAGKELGEYAKGKRESSAKKRDLMLEVQKMKMGAAKDDLAAVRALEAEAMKDRRAIAQELIKEYIASGKPQSDAGKQAMDMGLRPGTPEYQAKVGELAEFNVQRQMAGINNQLAQLTLAQANLTLRQQTAARLSPTEINMLKEGEDLVSSGQQALRDLGEAYRLNPNSLAGGWLERGQQFLFEAAGSNDPTIVNTRVINNLLGAQGLAKLRATFGGNPTEGERAILLELEGIGSKTREERATIMRRAYRVLQDRVAREQRRIDDLKSGAYRMTEPLPAAGEQ